MIKNYVINICTDSLRQQHIIEQFTKQAVDFEFFSAITSKNYVEVAKNLNIDIKKSVSSPNEIACFLSHASLWQKCVDENLGYVGIYEDDIFLGKNFNRIISQENFLQTNGIDLLKLEKVSPRVHLTNPIAMPNTGRTVYQLNSRHLGGAGYLLSSHACQYLLNYISALSQLEAVDVMLFDVNKYPKSLVAYQLNPAIVIQEHHLLPQISLVSSLNASRSREIKVKLTAWQKAKREMLRVFRPLYMSKLTYE